MTIRPAIKTDLPAMVTLIEAYRRRLQTWRPVFWNKAGTSDELSMLWFGHLMNQDNVLTLISEQGGKADGFLIASLIDAPPVYDISGKACMIDDYALETDALWASVGRDLLSEAKAWARQKGAVQVIVVSPTDHADKNGFMENEGLTETTKWWTDNL